MNATETYQETSISTQSKGRVVVMLYDGAIKFLRQGREAMVQQDYSKKTHFLAKARDIVFELNQSLNLQDGGALAQNLRSLYNFLWRYIGQAGFQNNQQVSDSNDKTSVYQILTCRTKVKMLRR